MINATGDSQNLQFIFQGPGLNGYDFVSLNGDGSHAVRSPRPNAPRLGSA